MMLIANVFPKLQTVENYERSPFKKRSFGRRFHRHHVKVYHVLTKSPWQHFCHVFLSFWEKLICKISPGLFHEILGVFLNTFTDDPKYPVGDWEIFKFATQMQLSEKRKTFSEFFVPFLEYTSNFKHFEIKDDGHS